MSIRVVRQEVNFSQALLFQLFSHLLPRHFSVRNMAPPVHGKSSTSMLDILVVILLAIGKEEGGSSSELVVHSIFAKSTLVNIQLDETVIEQ